MRLWLGTVLAIILLAGNANAEMVSVTANQAKILSDPSMGASYVITRAPLYFPLNVLGEQDGFFRVSDFMNRIGWISKSSVDNTRAVIVRTHTANVRRDPTTNSPIVFRAEEGVTFKVLDDNDHWFRVIHEDGMTGWIYKDLVWGE